MNMKKLVLFTLLFLMATKLFASDKDTILTVNLEASQSVPYGVDLVFKNNCKDTVILFGRFKNFLFASSWGSEPGFLIDFFKNGKQLDLFFDAGNSKEIEFYRFSSKMLIIPPRGKLKLNIPLQPYMGFDVKSEYKVRFLINYLCDKLDHKKHLPQEYIHVYTNYAILRDSTFLKTKR